MKFDGWKIRWKYRYIPPRWFRYKWRQFWHYPIHLRIYWSLWKFWHFTIMRRPPLGENEQYPYEYNPKAHDCHGVTNPPAADWTEASEKLRDLHRSAPPRRKPIFKNDVS
jgi:hypothetical protein